MAFYSKNGKEPSMKLVMKVGDPSGGQQKVTIFVAIDTSGSMSGAKINQVFISLQDLISKAPGYVRFVIRKFDEEVKTLVSKKKRYLDVNRLGVDLKKCGHMTALFDAWGQVINEIPYDVTKSDVHVLIFTDGVDNYSKTFNLESIVALVNEKMSRKVQLIFIQAGPHKAVANTIETRCNKNFCTVIKVEDSVPGIDYGFRQAKQQISFEINVDHAGFLARIGGLTLSKTTDSKHSYKDERSHTRPGITKGSDTLMSSRGNGLLPTPEPELVRMGPFRRPIQPNRYTSRGQIGNPSPLSLLQVGAPGHGNTNVKAQIDQQNQSLAAKHRGVKKTRDVGKDLTFSRTTALPKHKPTRKEKSFDKGQELPETLEATMSKLEHKMNELQDQIMKAGISAKSKPEVKEKIPNKGQASFDKQSSQYSVIVSGIPSNVTAKFPTKSISEILLEFFRKWGKCAVCKVGINANSMMSAKISYESELEKSAARYFGEKEYFHGTLLKIRDP